MSPGETNLRTLKRQWTRDAIAAATVELVVELGWKNVRIEDICARAVVGRSTFFRYFEAKETAFVTGVRQGRLDRILQILPHRPPSESPFSAVRASFVALCDDWREQRDALVLEHEIEQQSAAVRAWASADQHLWETTLAEAVAPRFADVEPDDLRPVMLAALAMSAARLTHARWVKAGAKTSPAPLMNAAFLAASDAVLELTA